MDPPSFTSPLATEISDAQEGDDVHMECRFAPVTDPKLQIFWYFNEKPLLTGSRFKMVKFNASSRYMILSCPYTKYYEQVHDFGYVSLDVKGVIPEDTGRYTCRAVNEKGEASSGCSLQVTPRPTMIFQRQAPSQTAQDLERHFK